jgi:hypothetical protein
MRPPRCSSSRSRRLSSAGPCSVRFSATRSAREMVSAVVAIVSAALAFGVYHFAHSPPFNMPEMVLLLSVVGGATGVFLLSWRRSVQHNCSPQRVRPPGRNPGARRKRKSRSICQSAASAYRNSPGGGRGLGYRRRRTSPAGFTSRSATRLSLTPDKDDTRRGCVRVLALGSR